MVVVVVPFVSRLCLAFPISNIIHSVVVAVCVVYFFACSPTILFVHSCIFALCLCAHSCSTYVCDCLFLTHALHSCCYFLFIVVLSIHMCLACTSLLDMCLPIMPFVPVSLVVSMI